MAQDSSPADARPSLPQRCAAALARCLFLIAVVPPLMLMIPVVAFAARITGRGRSFRPVRYHDDLGREDYFMSFRAARNCKPTLIGAWLRLCGLQKAPHVLYAGGMRLRGRPIRVAPWRRPMRRGPVSRASSSVQVRTRTRSREKHRKPSRRGRSRRTSASGSRGDPEPGESDEDQLGGPSSQATPAVSKGVARGSLRAV
jgi:hypothetical protein